MAGISDKPLFDKLGFVPGESIFLLNEPFLYRIQLEQAGLKIAQGMHDRDWGHIFVTSNASLQQFLNQTNLEMFKNGFWVSWPKKSSGIISDVGEQDLRDQTLPTGWVDVKVAAVDDTWSALKFVRRNVSN